VPKVYEVGCKHPVTDAQLASLRAGVLLDDDPLPVRAAAAERTGECGLSMTLTEGKYHQVKRMIAAAGNRVDTLHRGSAMTNPTGAGRVHIYQGKRAGNDGSKIDNNTPAGTALWDDGAKLKTYDMVILSCEGAENPDTKSAAARANIKEYLDQGGRLFASHYHYEWFKNGSTPLPSTAMWTNGSNADNSTDVSVDTTFAKGVAFGEWLDEVKATTAPKSGIVKMTALKTVDTSRRWLYTPGAPKFYSFNTPIGTKPADQCGRGVFTDIHVSSGDTPGGTFPANCTTSGYTAQEKALLFLMMDLASCIQDDNKPPAPPPAGPAVK